MDEKILEMVDLVNNMHSKNPVESKIKASSELKPSADAFVIQNKIQEMVLGIKRKS